MKNFKHIFLIISSLLFINLIYAQENDWREYLQQLSEEDMSESAIENMYQELLSLEGNPMNLNTVSREELNRFPLLSSFQANELANFLEKNRPVYTVYELRNVSQLDYNTVALILPFFYVGEKQTKGEKLSIVKILKKGRHEVQVRFDKTLTKRAGYGEFSDSILEKYPNRKYRGEDFYHSFKYAFTYRDKIQLGILGEKDAGEPFWQSDYRKGYDHYGFHLIVRDLGTIKTAALGDYRLSFGQGLVLNNDFMIPKSWAINNIVRRTIQPKRHFSTAENGFFRGLAAVIGVGKVNITAFYSHKFIDTNLAKDSSFTSFKTDGYHRTPLEIKKRHNTHEQITGLNINYNNNHLQIGLSGVYYQFNRLYMPTPRSYNVFYLRGSKNMNAGIDYSYRFSRFTFAGETAISQNGALATLNTLEFYPVSAASLTLLYRNYAKDYQALYANAFSDGGHIQNENGFYIGSTICPLPKLSVTMYLDFVQFPWLKYNLDKPSSTLDFYALSTYRLSETSHFELRYKFKQKEKNAKYPDKKTTVVLPFDTHKLRVRFEKSYENGWSFRTTLNGAYYRVEHFPKKNGWMLSQHIAYRGNSKIQSDLFVGYFNANSYYVRLYSYERNILNTFYMPSFYGKGIRTALSGRYNITKNLSFSIKSGYTRYFNRETISSGTEKIEGNSRLDVYTFLKWRF